MSSGKTLTSSKSHLEGLTTTFHLEYNIALLHRKSIIYPRVKMNSPASGVASAPRVRVTGGADAIPLAGEFAFATITSPSERPGPRSDAGSIAARPGFAPRNCGARRWAAPGPRIVWR